MTKSLDGDDTMRKIGAVGGAALIGVGLQLGAEATGLQSLIVENWLTLGAWLAGLVGVSAFLALFFGGSAAVASMFRSIAAWTRWIPAALAAALLSLATSPIIAGSIGLLAFFVPVLCGVPIVELFTDIPLLRLDGIDTTYTSPVESGIEGRIVGSSDSMPSSWELRDNNDRVLVRSSHSGRYELMVNDGSIELIGPLWIEDLGDARVIGVEEIRDLGIPRSYLFPEELFLAQRTLLAGDHVVVRGELRTEADWVGYRESAFRRRFVGRAGCPLLVRAG